MLARSSPLPTPPPALTSPLPHHCCRTNITLWFVLPSPGLHDWRVPKPPPTYPTAGSFCHAFSSAAPRCCPLLTARYLALMFGAIKRAAAGLQNTFAPPACRLLAQTLIRAWRASSLFSWFYAVRALGHAALVWAEGRQDMREEGSAVAHWHTVGTLSWDNTCCLPTQNKRRKACAIAASSKSAP